MSMLSDHDSVSNEAVKLTQEMIRIPSISGEENDLAEFIAGVMKQKGLLVQKIPTNDGRFNVMGKLQGTIGRPVLVMNGHMDVVPAGDLEKWSHSPFSGEVVDGRICGRGAADMKGGLASMIEAAHLLGTRDRPLKGTLVVQAVVDEERGGLEGTARILAEKEHRGTFAIVGEPTALQLLIAHKGCLRLEIVTSGVAAHAATPELGVNAIHKMIPIMNELLSLSEKHHWQERKHRLVGVPSMVISILEGGTAPNVIPESCRLIVDRRIVPSIENLDMAKREIEEILTTEKERDPSLNVKMVVTTEIEPMQIDEHEEIVESAKRATEHVLGEPCRISGMQAFSDAGWFARHGTAAINLGPGLPEDAHRVNESVEIEQLLDAVNIYHDIAADILA